MIVKIEEGTLKVITEVKAAMAPVVVKTYDDKGKVIDEYAFAHQPGRAGITETLFAANAIVDGKLAFITGVDTDDEDCEKDIKAIFGAGLVRSNRFEPSATAIVREQELAKARFDTELDMLINGGAAPALQPEEPEEDGAADLTADPEEGAAEITE